MRNMIRPIFVLALTRPFVGSELAVWPTILRIKPTKVITPVNLKRIEGNGFPVFRLIESFLF